MAWKALSCSIKPLFEVMTISDKPAREIETSCGRLLGVSPAGFLQLTTFSMEESQGDHTVHPHGIFRSVRKTHCRDVLLGVSGNFMTRIHSRHMMQQRDR